MADKDKKPKINIFAAFGGDGLSSTKVKAIILFIGYVFAVIFFIVPFMLGVGFQATAGGLNPGMIVGAVMAAMVIFIGGFT